MVPFFSVLTVPCQNIGRVPLTYLSRQFQMWCSTGLLRHWLHLSTILCYSICTVECIWIVSVQDWHLNWSIPFHSFDRNSLWKCRRYTAVVRVNIKWWIPTNKDLIKDNTVALGHYCNYTADYVIVLGCSRRLSPCWIWFW